jgi:serine/threonine-protein kinase HipA
VPPSPALEVYSSGKKAGSLARSDIHEGDFLFGYDAGCRPEQAVSLTMPVVRDQYDSMNTVHPIFEMNLPEGALLEKLRLRFAKAIPDFDDLALLEIVGQSQIGRLRYARPGARKVLARTGAASSCWASLSIHPGRLLSRRAGPAPLRKHPPIAFNIEGVPRLRRTKRRHPHSHRA